jgi:hypothetical protein
MKDAPNEGGDAPADACASIGVFDIPSEEVAKSVCAGTSPCKVCVQARDDAGAPRLWMAMLVSPECPCPSH